MPDEPPVDAPEEGMSLDLLSPCFCPKPLGGVSYQKLADHILYRIATFRANTLSCHSLNKSRCRLETAHVIHVYLY